MHCIVFASPPISTLPLPRFVGQSSQAQPSLFLSLLNEGDPIIKADRGLLAKNWLGTQKYRRAVRDIAVPTIRLFVHSGTILILSKRKESCSSYLSLQEADNKELYKRRAVRWSVHGMTTYKNRVIQLSSQADEVDKTYYKSCAQTVFMSLMIL
jgi:hypothetical protein